MAKSKFQIFKNWKTRYCKGEKGSYQKMRSACKRYVESEASKAPKGKKTATRKKAQARANVVLKKPCSIR